MGGTTQPMGWITVNPPQSNQSAGLNDVSNKYEAADWRALLVAWATDAGFFPLSSMREDCPFVGESLSLLSSM